MVRPGIGWKAGGSAVQVILQGPPHLVIGATLPTYFVSHVNGQVTRSGLPGDDARLDLNSLAHR